MKLNYLDEWTRQRQAIAQLYRKALSDIGDLTLPETVDGASHVYHLFVIRTNKRNELQQHLSERGIGTLIHYPIPPHLQPAYHELGFRRDDFPLAEEIANTCLSLPLWPGMKEADVAYVQEVTQSFFHA